MLKLSLLTLCLSESTSVLNILHQTKLIEKSVYACINLKFIFAGDREKRREVCIMNSKKAYNICKYTRRCLFTTYFLCIVSKDRTCFSFCTRLLPSLLRPYCMLPFLGEHTHLYYYQQSLQHCRPLVIETTFK